MFCDILVEVNQSGTSYLCSDSGLLGIGNKISADSGWNKKKYCIQKVVTWSK